MLSQFIKIRVISYLICVVCVVGVGIQLVGRSRNAIIYESKSDGFASWTNYSQEKLGAGILRRTDDSGNRTIELISARGGNIGINKVSPLLEGTIEFIYKIESSNAVGPHIGVSGRVKPASRERVKTSHL